jgi:A/G-specific adenine glycosylase
MQIAAQASVAPMKLRTRLLSWYARSHRDLPWRRTRDAYRVWVSEIMLQQTRVETVIPYYERFLVRFPDVRSLADAPLEDVLTHWSGLGYYRRARMLHAAAATIVREHAGRFPATLDAASELPGIGRSTAGAIVSISYGTRAPVLDGNVQRVLARVHALRGDLDRRAARTMLWSLAQELVDTEQAGDVNQALMELGATICLPFAAARCGECPVAELCLAREQRLVATLPEKAKVRAPARQTWAVAVIERGDRWLVRRRDEAGLLAGLFEFPTCELSDADAKSADSRRAALAAWLQESLGLSASPRGELLVHRHAISNRDVTERVFAATVRGRASGTALWLDADAIRALPITTATRRILDRLEKDAGAPLFRARRAVRSLPD